MFAALFIFTAAAWYSGNDMIGGLLLIMLGAVLAFLSYNLRFPWQRKAKLFMDNAGSAFLGFVIAWVSFPVDTKPHASREPGLAIWLIPVPILDCLLLGTFSGVCGLVAGQAMRLDVPHPVILGAFLGLCGRWYWMTSRRVRAVRFFEFVLRRGVFGLPVPTIIKPLEGHPSDAPPLASTGLVEPKYDP